MPTLRLAGGNNPGLPLLQKAIVWRLTRNANSNTVYFYCNGLQDYGREVIGVSDVVLISGIYRRHL
jgi:hypothetical protein